ncbi:DUF2520 domain-containing protein [candidate division KSB1 bacterium]|nr:DUF2520 domain-containing protein [candidate division KSB1 bacterium]
MNEKIGIIGAGRLGKSLARALCEAGCHVSAVSDKIYERALACSDYCGPFTKAFSLESLPPDLTLIFIAVHDDEIAMVAQQLSSLHIMSNTIIAHTSGALDLDVLTPLRGKTDLLASVHPVQTFSGADTDWKRFFGIFFGIEGSVPVVERISEVLKHLRSHSILIKPDKKVLYHLGCVFASNYLVAVLSAATYILKMAGFNEKQAVNVLEPLANATFENIKLNGVAKAATGPITRGDIGTVKRHMSALADTDQDIKTLYLTLGRFLARLVADLPDTDFEQNKAILNFLNDE